MVYSPRRGLTQFASLLSYLNWAGRVGASWCSPSVGPGFTTILAPSNGVRAFVSSDIIGTIIPRLRDLRCAR